MKDETRQYSLKGVTLTDLSITAIASVVGEYENPETGSISAEVEMEVIDEAAWEKFDAPKSEAHRCALCGHKLKISCAVTHKTTGHGYWIGRDCASTIESLKRFGDVVKGATVALAQRIACDKREADFLAANPDAISIIAWAKLPRAPRIARDMLEKMRRFGSISDKQIALLEKIRYQDEQRRATATAKVTTGRQVIKGTVMKVTVSADDFTPNKMIAKVIVDCGNGTRLMGNLPEYMTVVPLIRSRVPEYLRKDGCEASTHEVIKKGDVIELTASVNPSKNDELFGFWKRPAKFSILVLAPPPPPPAPKKDELFDVVLFESILLTDTQLHQGMVENTKANANNPQLLLDTMTELYYQAAERRNLSAEQCDRFVRAIKNQELFKPITKAS